MTTDLPPARRQPRQADILHVAVVGGSISGCAVAAALQNRGHDVTVFERTTTDRRDQGSAIVTPATVLSQLETAGLIGGDLPRCPADAIQYKTRGVDGSVRPLGEVALPLAAFEWTDLFQTLRDRVPTDRYRAGHHVIGVDDVAASRPSLRFADGGTAGPYDLVVFADGYRSIGRPLVSSAPQPSYSGYVFWRGLVDTDTLSDVDIAGTVTRVLYADGHAVFYQVPRDHGKERQTMWGCYRPVLPEELPGLLTDVAGTTHAGSTPRGMVRPDVHARFLGELEERLPARYVKVLRSTVETSVQAIFSQRVDRYVNGRLCVLGDAASNFPPYAGNGVLKAVSNAVTLSMSLAATDVVETMDVALAGWSQQQLTADASFAALADVNGRRLVSDVPSFDDGDVAAVTTWLHELHPGLPATVNFHS